MNKFTILFVLITSIACNTEKQVAKKTAVIAKAETSKTKKTIITDNMVTITDELYTLQFKIEKTDKQHHLIVDIKLHNGSSFISPFEKKPFTGKFYMDFGDDSNLSFDKDRTETPRARAIYDSFANEDVVWVKENTTYKQPLLLKTKEKFVVFGRVQFTIEPRCSFEEIPFGISYKEGVFSFIDPKC